MKCIAYILAFFSLAASLNVFSQERRVILTITKDSSIESNELKVQFYSGRSDVSIVDSFTSNHLKLNYTFYSIYAFVKINYHLKNGVEDDRIFFVGTKPAVINIRRDKISGISPFIFQCLNATNATDSSANSLYRDIFRIRIEPGNAITKLWAESNPKLSGEDKRILQAQYFKKLNHVTLDVIKRHPTNYFAFWYFGNQVVTPSVSLLGKDSTYLSYLVSYFNRVFPERYKKSFEGKNIQQVLAMAISPKKVNVASPNFAAHDITGRSISLHGLKGKYILLDFWASWCGPCLASIPLLKELSKKYPTNKLNIIGINIDQEKEKMLAVIADKNMSWPQIFDFDNGISIRFGVIKIPTFILIDPAGTIIFRGTGLADKEIMAQKLAKVLTL